MIYESLLDPDLYRDNPFVAHFIESLHEPEIMYASDEALSILLPQLIPTDDINVLLELLYQEAENNIRDSGSLSPRFAVFPKKDSKISLQLDNEIPTTKSKVQNFLHSGKALGFIRAAQCIFFSVMQPIRDNHPIFGEDVNNAEMWSIFLIGSSLRGNCFVSLTKISEKLCFKPIYQKILREGQYEKCLFSRFFHIKNDEEMCSIISRIPKVMNYCKLEEKDCLINFATTLKALEKLQYI